MTTERPILKVRLDPDTNKLRLRLPRKGSRWQGPFADITAAVDKALKEGVETPFEIDYVTEEN